MTLMNSKLVRFYSCPKCKDTFMMDLAPTDTLDMIAPACRCSQCADEIHEIKTVKDLWKHGYTKDEIYRILSRNLSEKITEITRDSGTE